MIKKVFPVFFVLGLALALFSLAYSQGVEVEPNNTCQTAQDLAGVTLPFPLDGNLEVLPGNGDVDFYRISGQPGLWVRVDLEGQATGQGTLQDPFIGAFDSYCGLFASDDNFNGLNAHLEFRIPYEGVFTLAATSCCDSNFVGNSGVGGTYKLTVAQVPSIGSISGRAVDASTGDPLPGSIDPFASAYLWRSDNYGKLAYVANQQLDDQGRFQFTQDSDGAPLIVGTYQVNVDANSYNSGNSGTFDVSEGENRDLDDIALLPLPPPPSISGRVVDAVSGNPLPGDGPLTTYVELQRCDEWGCSGYTSQLATSEGTFRFESPFGNPMTPGSYSLWVWARGYQDSFVGPFDLAEGEQKDVGDIALMPLPPPPSISGRIVDAKTGNPLPGDCPPYVSVELQSCDEWGCWGYTSQTTTSDGAFRFESSPWYSMTPGSYRLRVTANGYQESLVGPFDLAEGEQKELGDIALTPLPLPPSISGRIVDAKSESPLPGDSPPNTYVELQRCYDWGCWSIYSIPATQEGRFRFEGDPWNPLSPGSYRLRITASSYYESLVGPFDLVEGEQKDLGDIPLSPITFIGSIQGRVVDAINDQPLAASVTLFRCYVVDGVCSGASYENTAYTNGTGAFSFERDDEGNPLQSGLYYISVYADQYFWQNFESFEVDENEHKDLGDITLTPFPVRFSDVQPCNDVPSKGGKCSYSVRVTNRQTTQLEGSAWSLVETDYLGSFIEYTNFQAGLVSLKLDPEQSTVVQFNFQVPETVPDGATICTKIYVGQGKFEGYFYPQGYIEPFCMYKGAETFEVMSEEETSRLMRQKHQPAVVPSPK